MAPYITPKYIRRALAAVVIAAFTLAALPFIVGIPMVAKWHYDKWRGIADSTVPNIDSCWHAQDGTHIRDFTKADGAPSACIEKAFVGIGNTAIKVLVLNSVWSVAQIKVPDMRPEAAQEWKTLARQSVDGIERGQDWGMFAYKDIPYLKTIHSNPVILQCVESFRAGSPCKT